MADLRGRTDDRGQLIVITALGIALLLVLLALALNTAVFGEVHVASTDDSRHEERAATQYEASVRRGVGPLQPKVNDATSGGYSDLKTALAGEISNWSRITTAMHAHTGVATSLDTERVHYETDVTHDNETKGFVNESGATEWTAIDGAERVSRYETTVTDVNDVAPGDCFGKDNCFNVSVNSGAWILSIYEKNSTVAVKVAGESECTAAPPATINVTNGSLNGSACFTPFTEDPDIGAPYTIRYTNADNVSGRWGLAADGRVDDADYYDDDSGDSPRFDPRIVAANVTVSYRSSELHYRNELRIEAGDPDG